MYLSTNCTGVQRTLYVAREAAQNVNPLFHAINLHNRNGAVYAGELLHEPLVSWRHDDASARAACDTTIAFSVTSSWGVSYLAPSDYKSLMAKIHI